MVLAICLLANVAMFAQNPNVYVGGICNSEGAIWRNGVAEVLSDVEQVYFIVMDGSDEYAAGRTNGLVPVVWKNGVELYRLEGEYQDRSISSMAVSNGKVYVTTIELTSTWQFKAMVWIDGVASEDYPDAAEINGIFVDGEDVYVAGRTNTEGVIWKNAEPLYTCTSDFTPLFCDVTVVDGDVYYVGGDFGGGAGKTAAVKRQGEVPAHQQHNRDFGVKVWKNGEELYFLAEELYSGRINVLDGTVYVTGQTSSGSIYRAYLWTNGEATPLSDEWSGTGTMCIYNNDIYVTGFKGNYPDLDAYIWKNGELTTLATGGYNYGNCIVVFDGETGIEENQAAFAAYPNPSNNFITIEGIEFNEAAIYNNMGQLVLTTKEKKIDVSALASGLYLLRLDRTSSKNIVIQH